jgi:hypothetical protein
MFRSGIPQNPINNPTKDDKWHKTSQLRVELEVFVVTGGTGCSGGIDSLIFMSINTQQGRHL